MSLRRGLLLGTGSVFLFSLSPITVSSDDAVPSSFTEPESAGVSTQDDLLQQADLLEKTGRSEEAIPLYENLINQGSGRDSRWNAYLFFRLACAQYQVGDRAGAIESAGGAVNLDPEEPSYRAFQSELSGEGSGKSLSSVYRAERNQGSAQRLSSSNGILHIFVRGRNTLAWDQEEVDQVRRHMAEADRWIQARAVESDPRLQPVFEHRFLILPDDPLWRRIDVPSAESSKEYRMAWIKAVRTRFNAGSYAELFDKVFEGKTLANRGILFHASLRDAPVIGMAPCRKTPTDIEGRSIQLARSDRTDSYETVTYTHSLLHLYGADDLYTKVHDPNIPERDVMNFGAYQLEDCELSALTRYAIGWTEQCPRLINLRVDNQLNGIKPRKGKHV